METQLCCWHSSMMWPARKLFVIGDKTCTRLCDAIAGGSMAEVDHALETGADVNQRCDFHETPLTQACASGNRDLVEKLLQRKACVNGGVRPRCTPLIAAVRRKYIDIVQCLLENDANPNVQTLNGKTALHEAVLCKREARMTLVQLLLKNNAELRKDKNGHTPLSLAARHGRMDLLDSLFEVQPKSREERINALELFAAFRAPHDMATVFEFLQRAMEERYSDPSNVLYKPDQVSDSDLDYILESRSPQELSKRKRNHAALFIECLAIRKRNAQYRGFHCKKKWNDNSYRWLLSEGLHKEVCFILANETEVVCQVFYEMFHLPLATFRLMLYRGKIPEFADVLMYVKACKTHLKNRVQRSKDFDYIKLVLQDVLEYLLLCICIVDVGNNKVEQILEDMIKDISNCLQYDYHPVNTNSLLTAAVHEWKWTWLPKRKSQLQTLIMLLLKTGASANCRTRNGDTPLHILAKNDDDDACFLARLLLENGADLDFLDAQGQTPAQCAVTEEMRTLLKSIVRPLQCLAAHVILEHKLSLDPLPDPLKRFVTEHRIRRV